MKVRAKMLGFYGMERRRDGAEFEIDKVEDFSHDWMEALDFKAPKRKRGRDPADDLRPRPAAKVKAKAAPVPETEQLDQNSDVI